MHRRPTDAPRARPAVAVAWTALGIVAVAGLGMLGTDLGPWYRALRQPPWQPPDWAFGPAWTLIYLLTGTAAVRVWTRARSADARRRWLGALLANGALNVAWSWLFFRLRRPDWALAEVLLLWASVALLVVLARRDDTLAALLLLPYLLWVGFAATLNLAVVRLNAPF